VALGINWWMIYCRIRKAGKDLGTILEGRRPFGGPRH